MNVQKVKNILFCMLCAVLFLVGGLSVIDDVAFILTKEEASAKVLRATVIKENGLANELVIEYFNKYESKSVKTYLDDLDFTYVDNIRRRGESLRIYYYCWFPKTVYIPELKYPGWGEVILGLIFSSIFLGGTYITYYNIKTG